MRVLAGVMFWAIMAPAQVAPVPPPGNVALPLGEYNELLEMAGKPVKKSESPPLRFAIQRAEMAFDVTGSLASGTVRLEGEVFTTGAVKAPLMSGLTVFDARREGSTLPLLWDGAANTAVLTGPSDFRVTLEVGTAVNTEAGRASLSIPAPAATAVQLVLTVPGDNSTVNLNGGLIVSRTSSSGRTTINATLTGGQLAHISWNTHETAVPAAPREPRYLSDLKSLVMVREGGIAMAALVELSVVQGEPREFSVKIPAGWEVTGATGATMESSEMQDTTLVLKTNRAARSHAFLITMERPVIESKAEVAVISLPATQRETGEILVESEGVIELAATEAAGVRRMDLKEASAYLRRMAHDSAQAAFRYHREPGKVPAVSLEWTRFADANLPGAVAESAIVTTLVTSAGRSLTEVKLLLRNHAQPFLKVDLAAGTTILSADVARQAVKPVQGNDGARVPLLRPGFHPSDVYTVSFVFMHSGAPFAGNGGSELALPKMDVPVGFLEWDVFLPERYQVKEFGGNAFAASLLPLSNQDQPARDRKISLQPGELGGYIVDAGGALIPGVRVTVRNEATGATETATAGGDGRWLVSNIPPGPVRIEAAAPGFQTAVRHVIHLPGEGTRVSFALQVGAVTETVNVESSSAAVRTENRQTEKQVAQQQTQPSTHVMDLKQRVSGVLPISIEVPKAGASYRFVRPLVVDEETKLTFTYRARK